MTLVPLKASAPTSIALVVSTSFNHVRLPLASRRATSPAAAFTSLPPIVPLV